MTRLYERAPWRQLVRDALVDAIVLIRARTNQMEDLIPLVDAISGALGVLASGQIAVVPPS